MCMHFTYITHTHTPRMTHISICRRWISPPKQKTKRAFFENHSLNYTWPLWMSVMVIRYWVLLAADAGCIRARQWQWANAEKNTDEDHFCHWHGVMEKNGRGRTSANCSVYINFNKIITALVVCYRIPSLLDAHTACTWRWLWPRQRVKGKLERAAATHRITVNRWPRATNSCRQRDSWFCCCVGRRSVRWTLLPFARNSSLRCFNVQCSSSAILLF